MALAGSVVLSLLVATSGSGAAIWPSAVTRAEAELGASDPAVRREVVARLADLPRASARRLLLRALDDADPLVASSALELLLRLETPSVTERVVPWLSGADKRLRLAAALSLAVAPVANAVPALGRALGDSDAEVRAAAATALGASRSDAAALPLLGHLDDSVPEVREAVVHALGALGDPRAVLPLIGKIEDPRPPVRAAVARALGSLRDPRSASALLLSLRDSDRGVVVAVVRALGALAEPAAVGPLAASLKASPDPETRRAVLLSLGRIGTPDAGRALVEELAFDEPGRERDAVLAAFSGTGGVFTPALRACLDGSVEPSRAEGCALGLVEARDIESAGRIRAGLDRGQLAPKVGLSALGRLGDASALGAALERLTVPDAATRRAALEAAELLLSPKEADGRAVEPLARAIASRGATRAERLRLVTLLGRTGSQRALSTLLPLLETTEDEELAEHAAAALGSIPGGASARALLAALRREPSGVKGAAALSIRRNASPALLAPLLEMLERGGRRDRQLAYLALPGPLSTSTDDGLVARAARRLGATSGSERDELVEALAVSSRRPARAALLALARSADAADRAKLAEVLSGAPDAAVLLELARDAQVSVRRNAVWSLGFTAGAAPSVKSALLRALADRDAAVVGNAAVSLGRLGSGDAAVVTALCGAPLEDARASVREQALRALALSGGRCANDRPAQLLATDGRARVRRAAAELVKRGPVEPSVRRLLQRCEESDPHAAVAQACGAPVAPAPAEWEPVTLLIVPTDGGEPAPGAAFSLLLPDGGLRLGSADRRGGVFEPRAPQGGAELSPYPGGD
jgi:cellulose synthase operon protein C